MTALLAQAQGLPAYQIVMAAVNVFAFMCLGVASIFHGVLRYDEMKARLNPRDKLKLEPSFWITKGGPDNSLIEEMQLGFDVKNTATFPIIYRVTNLSTTFDNYHIPRNDFPWGESEILSLDKIESRDNTLILRGGKERPMGAIYFGTVQITYEFWRAGRRRKHTGGTKYNLEVRFDLPSENMIYYKI